jgi:hypothetical protein
MVRNAMVCTLLGGAIGAAGQTGTVRIPFVGCKSDGQVGPLKAPVGDSKVVPIAADVAAKLAYYKAEDGDGVLAPRGWYCFGRYGSNGEILYVSPDPIHGAELLSDAWKGFAGPVVQLSVESGDTSGRFGVAKMMARVFPAHREFVRKVIAEGIEPASAFPSGPYPKDKLRYRSNEMVEYETPAETEGLGTQSRLLKNGEPIQGMAMLIGQTPDLSYLAVRLPSGMGALVPVIVQQAERDAAKSAEQ